MQVQSLIDGLLCMRNVSIDRLEYIRYADQYVNVQGGPSHMNYSNCELILDIARRFGVQGTFVEFAALAWRYQNQRFHL